MDWPGEQLGSLRDILARERAVMEELIDLAAEEQRALLSSDFAAVQHVSDRMLYAARRMDVLEEEREATVREVRPGATLTDLVPIAEDAGITGLGETCDALVKNIVAYREIQDRNAQLILASIKIRERWVSVLAGMTSAGQTYGAEGRGNLQQRRGLVSRSA